MNLWTLYAIAAVTAAAETPLRRIDPPKPESEPEPDDLWTLATTTNTTTRARYTVSRADADRKLRAAEEKRARRAARRLAEVSGE